MQLVMISKNADFTVVQQTVTKHLHRDCKPQTVIVKPGWQTIES